VFGQWGVNNFYSLQKQFVMAKSNNNIVTKGLSGRIDELVFRQRFGQTVVTRNPRVSRDPTDAQLDLRSRFRQAAAYAKAAVSDAATKVFYGSKAKKGQSAYNVALADFFNTPEIGEIDTSAYNGSIGSRIMVPVTDGGKVVSVKVKIQKGDGTLIEEGAALQQSNGLDWMFIARAVNDSLSGSIITVSATDLPNHSSLKQTII
jgi:hypothetical protein